MEKKVTPLSTRKGGKLSSLVLKALGLFGGIQMLTVLCGVVRVKLVVLLLGAGGVGLFAIFNSALTLVSTFSQMNIRTSAVREVASRASDLSLQARMAAIVRRWCLWLGVLGLVVMIAAAPVFSLRTFGSLDYLGSFMLLAPAVFFLTLSGGEQVVLQGTGRLKSLASSSVWAVVAGLVLTVLLIWQGGEHGIVPSLVAANLTAWLAVRWYARRALHPVALPSWRGVWREGLPMVRLGLYMTVAFVLAELFNYIFISYLTLRDGVELVGHYQAGYTIMNRYVGMVFTAIGVEFYPRLTGVIRSARRTGTYVSHESLLLALILLGLLTAFIPFVPLAIDILYSNDFQVAAPFIYLGLPGIVLRALSICISYVILARGDGKAFVITEVLSEGALLLLNFLFYDLWGLAGLGAASSLNFLLYFFIVSPWYFGRYGMKLSPRAAWVVGVTFLTVLASSLVAFLISPLASALLILPALPASLYGLHRLLS